MSHPLNEKRLQPLKRRADAAEEAAARQLQVAQDAWRHQQQRLHELCRFRADYRQAGTASTSAAQWSNRAAFVARVEDAVQMQQCAVEQAERSVDAARERWIASRREVLTVEHLIEQARTRQRLAQDRQAQRGYDEIAARRHSAHAEQP